MPWTASQAKKHTRRAGTPKKRRMWRDVANAVLEKTGDDGRAIKIANSVVKKSQGKRSHKRS